MKISELIEALKMVKKQHGDLPVEGAFADTPITKVLAVNEGGCDFDLYPKDGPAVLVLVE